MSKAKLISLVCIVALVLAVLGYCHYIHTSKYVIARRVQSLAEHIRKNPQNGNIQDTYHALAFSGLLEPQVEVNIDELPYIKGVFTAEELQGRLAQAKLLSESIDLKVDYIEVYWQKSTPESAFAECIFSGKAKLKTGDVFEDRCCISIILVKREGKWRFSRFTTPKVMKR